MTFLSILQAATVAISLIDFGKKDGRSSLVRTSIDLFVPFPPVPPFPSPSSSNSISSTNDNSKNALRNGSEKMRKRKVKEQDLSSRSVFLDIKNVIFTRTKVVGLWNPALKETTTATGAPPDEYERPDDLKEININRIEARNIKNENITQDNNNKDTDSTVGSSSIDALLPSNLSFDARLKMSVFGQLMDGIKHWDDRPLRRSFVHMQDAGQARAFFVKFTGAYCFLLKIQ